MIFFIIQYKTRKTPPQSVKINHWIIQWRKGMDKNSIILNGSPRMNGNTAALRAAFAEGAQSAGHAVARFDLGKSNAVGLRPAPSMTKEPADGGAVVYEAGDGRMAATIPQTVWDGYEIASAIWNPHTFSPHWPPFRQKEKGGPGPAHLAGI